VLKIDQRFILRMLENDTGFTLVRALINLAHDLDLEVVAEGVETEAVSAALDGLECELLQGFLFSRPLPAPELTTWLEQHPAG
jgi:EAL domain-containing protein (putative c-di-GMP-specific phosphodiesterase class I)